MRETYENEGIDETQLHADPIEQFKLWFEEHKNLGVVRVPNAMILATCGEDGKPSARYVLLKGLEHGGFVFYTNYESKKAQQIEENAHAALCFYMEALHRQVVQKSNVIHCVHGRRFCVCRFGWRASSAVFRPQNPTCTSARVLVIHK